VSQKTASTLYFAKVFPSEKFFFCRDLETNDLSLLRPFELNKLSSKKKKKRRKSAGNPELEKTLFFC
jgi:hypothetical protein